MAVKWEKVYRGGVHRTIPETREVNYTGAITTILPGAAAALDATDGITGVVAEGQFFYFVGEQLYGSIDENQVRPAAQKTTLRLYSPRSGDLYAARAAAGIALVDDLPLTINAQGQFAAATLGTDPVFAYVDMPDSAFPKTEPLTTTADQVIPVKIK